MEQYAVERELERAAPAFCTRGMYNHPAAKAPQWCPIYHDVRFDENQLIPARGESLRHGARGDRVRRVGVRDPDERVLMMKAAEFNRKSFHRRR